VKGMRTSGKQSTRSRRQAESPSFDLPIRHHLSGGFRRSSSELSTAAVRQRSRQWEREGEDDAGKRGGTTGRADRATGQVRLGRLAPTGGPRLVERERWEGEVFNQKFKNRNWIKEKGF
jgi:hypothetical protein